PTSSAGMSQSPTGPRCRRATRCPKTWGTCRFRRDPPAGLAPRAQTNGVIVMAGRVLAMAAASLVSAFAWQAAWAQSSDTIDRPVTIYAAGTAGGGIDLFARAVARHIGRHIPGTPTVTVQDMPGAGGIRAANFLAEHAPRDGTAMTTFAGGP